jgi:AcrR family transcriptional regulator
MPSQADTPTSTRAPLSPQRVFAAAVALADEGDIRAVTMRAVAERLGVEAMSLYYHVANKEAVLDGMVDAVVEEIEAEVGGFGVPDHVDDWQSAVRARILAAREVMLRHPWAPAVIESRTTLGSVVLRHFDGLLGLMHAGGCSWDLVHHASHALGSRALGFSGELFEPGDDGDEEETEAMLASMAEQLPHVAGMLAEVVHDEPGATIGWCDDQTEFEFGLDILLEGIERRRLAE